MGFVELTTLADAAATIVVVSLWNHENAIEVIRNHSPGKKFDDPWEIKMESKIIDNIQTLPLTTPSKDYVLDCSLFIGQQIKKWMKKYKFLTVSSEAIMTLYSWKPKFIINDLEMAKRVILHEKNTLNSFRLACINCMDDVIFKLWPTVSLYFDDDAKSNMEVFEVKFWIKWLKKDVENLLKEGEYFQNRYQLYGIAYTVAISHNSMVFAEHFLKKMQTEEASKLVNNTLKKILETSDHQSFKAIFFFMHYLNDAEQEILICNYPIAILMQCLDYPLSGLFEKIINKNCSFLSKETFYQLTKGISIHMNMCIATNRLTSIFIEFWKNGPPEWKDYVIACCIKDCFFMYLGVLRNTACVLKSIIKSSTSDQKREMIFSKSGMMFFDGLIRTDRLGCLSMSVKEFSHLEERTSWIDDLINTYRNISSHDDFIGKENFEKLINLLENEKNTIFPASV